MQVIRTVNDTIRVLFNPKIEGFRLLDFLIVQDRDEKFLAQIIEIYDDKYDASQNVARVKLFFKINDKGEIFDYNHYTPSKECEIKKVRRDEILTFINENKEALSIGLDMQNSEPFDINLNFLKNSSVIFADKLDQSNLFSAHLAKTLSRYNLKSVIFDYTGTLEIEGAKKLVATVDFKLPLDFYSIDYIWDKGLQGASLETIAICREIFNEIQTFVKNTPEGYIPFNKFLKVVSAQYQATPITELTVLLNMLKSYQKNNIFAKCKKDFECIQRSIDKNTITIIDFSLLKSEWHKEFSEFVIRALKGEAFVFLRLNDNNSDVDLINHMYDKKPQLHFIPSISYSFKKMPHIIERTKNYILLPTLSPRRDFGAANFELCSMADDECILFGEDTENFIFTIKNNIFEKPKTEEPKALKTIRLKIDETPYISEPINKSHQQTPQEDQQETVLTEEELEFFNQMQEELPDQLENEEEAEEELLEKKSDEGDTEQTYHEEEILEEEPQTIIEAQTPADEEILELEITDVEPEAEEAENETYIEEEPETQVVFEEPESEAVIEQAVQEEEIPEVEYQEEDIKEETESFKNILKEEDETEESSDESDDGFSLETIAQQSIEATFSQVVEDTTALKKEETPQAEDSSKTLIIDENVVIDLEKIKDSVDTQENELPIFKSKKEENKEKYEFQTGDKVEHDKYGEGEVVKVINYANRSLLQINFKEIGKRLLDPDIAKIKPL